jgi:hypothetical protein
VPSLILFLCAGPARPQISSANYTFVVASGFLCDPGDSGSCPAVAKSTNGDSYEISGAGTFDPQNKSVKAAGTYTHKSPNGNVLETGVWLANELLSFDSYGIAPGALWQKGAALGPQSFGAKRLPISYGPMPTGGLAVFRIRLLPMSRASETAVLQVNCALGDVPRERSVEGIRVTLERNSTEFSEEVSGRVIFLSMRPEIGAPTKTPRQETTPDSTGPPSSWQLEWSGACRGDCDAGPSKAGDTPGAGKLAAELNMTYPQAPP